MAAVAHITDRQTLNALSFTSHTSSPRIGLTCESENISTNSLASLQHYFIFRDATSPLSYLSSDTYATSIIVPCLRGLTAAGAAGRRVSGSQPEWHVLSKNPHAHPMQGADSPRRDEFLQGRSPRFSVHFTLLHETASDPILTSLWSEGFVTRRCQFATKDMQLLLERDP